jgi:DnaJ-class molecular chaperone
MALEKCPDCDYVSSSFLPSNGKCSACHGSGYTGALDAFAKGLTGQSQHCETCGGSGKCQTCFGKGYIWR